MKDGNILIRAILTQGKPFQVLRWVLDNGILIFSDPTFEELATRLKKPAFGRYVSQDRRDEFHVDLEAVAEWAAINGVAHADCIVTGDGDLLALDHFEHLRIMTAAGFLEMLSRSFGQPAETATCEREHPRLSCARTGHPGFEMDDHVRMAIAHSGRIPGGFEIDLDLGKFIAEIGDLPP